MIYPPIGHRTCNLQVGCLSPGWAPLCNGLGQVAPLVSVITMLHYVANIFHHRVWYHVLSLHYVCIQSSAIILTQATFVPNLV